jgi:hypothetical protein
MPELKSPFAISQAGTALLVLSAMTDWIESIPKHNALETEDLKQTFDALRPHGESAILEAAGFREAIEGGVRASDEDPPDLSGMETAIGALAGGVATGTIVGAVAAEVRGYIRRHLERMRPPFGNNSPFG